MAIRYYYLEDDGRTFTQCHEPMNKWLEKTHWKVLKKTYLGDVEISTIFLGMDMNATGEGAPILWETVIFGGLHDSYQERYSTYDEAAAGHEKAVSLVEESAH